MKKRIKDIEKVTCRALDLLMLIVSYCAAYVVAGDRFAQGELLSFFSQTLPAILIVKYAVFHFSGMFKDITGYLSVSQLKQIFKSTGISFIILFSLSAFFKGISTVSTFPPHVFFVDFLCSVVLLCLRRIIPFKDLFNKSQKKEKRRVLIVGAGEAGELIAHAIKKHNHMPYKPICFVDDDYSKIGKNIHGIPVVGSVPEIAQIAESKNIDEVLIAIASASGEEIRRIVEHSKKASLPITTVPALGDLLSGNARVEEIRSVNTNDLLRRRPVKIDTTKVSTFLNKRSIMITGAGGSIGSELTRQVSKFSPGRIFLLDQSEVNLFNIEKEMERVFPDIQIVPILADITDQKKIDLLLEEYKPDILFHTAAYKHVGLLQGFAPEAFKNNVLGTRYLAESAVKAGVKRFVFVSTDKAVDPICVMGHTKRIAETYLKAYSKVNKADTKFITVRFGNVLGSAGSVVRIFEDQIRRHQDLTVTHPEAERFFMTISEASQLIMQAGVLGEGGEVFLLKMGEPVKIVDLAKNMITLSGLVFEKDISIVYTGLKPGEKLSEILVGLHENAQPTCYAEIMRIENERVLDFSRLEKAVEDLGSKIYVSDNDHFAECLAQLAIEEQAKHLK